MKKVLIPLLIIIGIISVISGITLVYAGVIHFGKEVSFHDISSENLYTDSSKLNSVIVGFESNSNIENAFIASTCEVKSTFLLENNSIYYFELQITDMCEASNFVLQEEEIIFPNSSFKLNVSNTKEIFNLVIDYPTEKIVSSSNSVKKYLKQYLKYNFLNENSGINFFESLKKNRIYKELEYKNTIISGILNKRNLKYSVPVKGYTIATGLNVIPNAARHYREGYTDGIHHGWDINAPEGTPVSAIDDGIIVRIVKDFSYEDISNMKKTGTISHTQKLRNLDILRGNQVWLKTTKGDVVFYSHLKEVFDEIEEGMIVNVGTELGTIGKTGVPDKNYTNFHLHFPIQKNPYTLSKAGKYSLEDYMNWDWYLKGLDPTSVINGQAEIFIEEVEHEKK